MLHLSLLTYPRGYGPPSPQHTKSKYSKLCYSGKICWTRHSTHNYKQYIQYIGYIRLISAYRHHRRAAPNRKVPAPFQISIWRRTAGQTLPLPILRCFPFSSALCLSGQRVEREECFGLWAVGRLGQTGRVVKEFSEQEEPPERRSRWRPGCWARRSHHHRGPKWLGHSVSFSSSAGEAQIPFLSQFDKSFCSSLDCMIACSHREMVMRWRDERVIRGKRGGRRRRRQASRPQLAAWHSSPKRNKWRKAGKSDKPAARNLDQVWVTDRTTQEDQPAAWNFSSDGVQCQWVWRRERGQEPAPRHICFQRLKQRQCCSKASSR